MSISREQLKAARALLGWTRSDVAVRAGVTDSTIGTFERGESQPLPSRVIAIRRVLEAAGVEFTNGGQPGVRMKGKAEVPQGS